MFLPHHLTPLVEVTTHEWLLDPANDAEGNRPKHATDATQASKVEIAIRGVRTVGTFLIPLAVTGNCQ